MTLSELRTTVGGGLFVPLTIGSGALYLGQRIGPQRQDTPDGRFRVHFQFFFGAGKHRQERGLLGSSEFFFRCSGFCPWRIFCVFSPQDLWLTAGVIETSFSRSDLSCLCSGCGFSSDFSCFPLHSSSCSSWMLTS